MIFDDIPIDIPLDMIVISVMVFIVLGFFINVASPIGSECYACPEIITNDCHGNVSYGHDDPTPLYLGCVYTTPSCKIWWYSFCAV